PREEDAPLGDEGDLIAERVCGTDLRQLDGHAAEIDRRATAVRDVGRNELDALQLLGDGVAEPAEQLEIRLPLRSELVALRAVVDDRSDAAGNLCAEPVLWTEVSDRQQQRLLGQSPRLVEDVPAVDGSPVGVHDERGAT